MTRAFNDKEKNVIREKLIEKGKVLFGQYGLKKTNIAELTKAVGIAQGSFYSFFESKEELYFEIIEREEQYIKEKLVSRYLSGRSITGASLRDFLLSAFRMVDDSTIIKRLYMDEDYEILVRRLPEEKLREHIGRDSDILAPMIRNWQKDGVLIDGDPEVIGGLLRMLFTVSLHKKEIGEAVYQRALELMIELVAKGLVKEEKRGDND